MKKGILTSLLLFGIIFGAGNLIFPPTLGLQSGSEFPLAILGFLVSDVGISIGAIILGVMTLGGYSREIEQKISPTFSILFLVVLYLTLGPIFAIPRTAAVSYEMGFSSFVSNNSLGLLVYSGLYFFFAYILAIHPSGIVTSVGKVLTPIFASLILLLVIMGVIKYAQLPSLAPYEMYQNGKALGAGFSEGYNTLDAIGAVPFSVVAISTLRQLGFKSKKEYTVTISVVGVLTALAFCLFYVGLSFLGNKFPVPQEVLSNPNMNFGIYILSESTRQIFGDYASIFLSVMVAVTCFTTAVGLIVATADYFAKKFPRLRYKTYVLLFTLMSFGIANIGLNQIILIAVPVLRILGPLVIAVVWFVLINKWLPLSRLGMQMTMVTVGVISFVSVIASIFKIDSILTIVSYLPLSNQSMEWIMIVLLGTVLALVLPNRQKGEAFDFEQWNKFAD
ncbi:MULTISPECIES: branched-chain amino acid transport system II carrier protein [unclassified Granulicatella]|uniref:branched-chain amino acid transport system II carrier protein n=1 Tax=unclassified Granulicatella TaxID=2630493 RepID=UPI0010730BA2|nr:MULTISPECIES: branched-chain amino acid transport system II carrier protein [unclassified Granulicatella]MBF0781050.1 branched-chain amino acid transport system II carrier protein [Granulicatella sp. 19428wC4_WM01]TFU92440.1 branched-chain amino acid transport system II carrier protein [Granulicatella sp. WM01]